MTGAEVAWRTLNREPIEEACIISCWMMKREFFRHYAGVQDIYANPVRTAVDAFAEAGCNLNPQFIMPSPIEEHCACDPFHLPPKPWRAPKRLTIHEDISPEQVRDDLDQMAEAGETTDAQGMESAMQAYAERLLDLRSMSQDRTLYIGGFGMPSFMGGYTRWTYEGYLSALVLYPDHFRRYFDLQGKNARRYNQALAQTIKERDIAPVVYGGDDICFNEGPICSVETLDRLYFPALRHALEPLVEAGIQIVWHCDGDVLPIVPRLIDIGVAGFQGFQEQEANIPLEEMVKFQRKDGGKLIFFGSLSVVHTLPFGTPDEVKRDVERCFTLAGPGGGFCLASSSSVLPETPMENIRAFLEHGKAFGREFYGGRATPPRCKRAAFGPEEP